MRSRAKGEPVNSQTDGPTWRRCCARGEVLYNTVSVNSISPVSIVTFQHQGRMLRGRSLSRGQANGFPKGRIAANDRIRGQEILPSISKTRCSSPIWTTR